MKQIKTNTPRGGNMSLESKITDILRMDIPTERQQVLQELINYIQGKKDQKERIILNFICTHNSRRSQFSQIWAQLASFYYKIDIISLSGGIEVTAFNYRAVESLQRFGFTITSEGARNPIFKVRYAGSEEPLEMFSKLHTDEVNFFPQFAAVMTCDHADQNCPVILGADQRISVNYVDPGNKDNTPDESDSYDNRSMQIASEMFYVFSKIK